jgi:hypothetical protein
MMHGGIQVNGSASAGAGQEGRGVDVYVDVTQAAWERLVGEENWTAAAEVGRLSSLKRPKLYYGGENWAWALHKQGRPEEAYDLLAPMMRELRLAGPPSGRSAWCLACFCAVLGKRNEAKRWLRLAATMARDEDAFHSHTLREPDLQELWLKTAEAL